EASGKRLSVLYGFRKLEWPSTSSGCGEAAFNSTTRHRHRRYKASSPSALQCAITIGALGLAHTSRAEARNFNMSITWSFSNRKRPGHDSRPTSNNAGRADSAIPRPVPSAHHAVLEAAETTKNNQHHQQGAGACGRQSPSPEFSILPKANTRDQNCPAALAATHSKKKNAFSRH
ncbi:unnamed protein product, partial [Ectocarpus fasciculatus]